MKKSFILSCILLCVSMIFAKEMFVVNSNSQTLSRVDINTFGVNNAFVQIGLYGNHVVFHEDKLFVVNSGDNNFQIFNGVTGSLIRTVNLENSCNPWQIILRDNYAYITGLYSGKLYKVNLSDTANRTELFLGTGPEGMLIIGDKMFVALTGFQYPDFEQGKVSVVDLNTFSVDTEIPVATNPQGLVRDNQGNIHVVCTGNYSSEMGKAVVINGQTNEVIQTIPFSASLSTIQMGPDGLIYLGEANGSGFYSYNPETYEIVNNANNPAFPGGDSMLYDDEYLYVLAPNWISSSKLFIYTHEKSLVQQVNLGIGSLSMALKQNFVSVTDIVKPNISVVHAYPNPFNQEINFKVKNHNQEMKMEIFNIKGQKIAESIALDLQWNGKDSSQRDVPAGVYFARITIDKENIVTKKIMMLK